MALFERPEGLSMAQSLLERRRIEAQFAKAIFDVLAEETSRERAAGILAKAVIRLATEAGAAFAGQRREPPDKKAPDDPAGSWPMRKSWRSGSKTAP